MANATTDVGHIYIMGGVVCNGCGALVYVSSDAITNHLAACSPLKEYNRKRLAGEPR